MKMTIFGLLTQEIIDYNAGHQKVNGFAPLDITERDKVNFQIQLLYSSTKMEICLYLTVEIGEYKYSTKISILNSNLVVEVLT